MRANSRAIQSYGDVKVSSGVASANNVQLIQMLFDGLLESCLLYTSPSPRDCS